MQQVEEISPSGQKRQIGYNQESPSRTVNGSASKSYKDRTTEKRAANPFLDENDAQRNIFSVKMSHSNRGSMEGGIDINCRKDLPDRPVEAQGGQNTFGAVKPSFNPNEYVAEHYRSSDMNRSPASKSPNQPSTLKKKKVQVVGGDSPSAQGEEYDDGESYGGEEDAYGEQYEMESKGMGGGEEEEYGEESMQNSNMYPYPR